MEKYTKEQISEAVKSLEKLLLAMYDAQAKRLEVETEIKTLHNEIRIVEDGLREITNWNM